MSPYTKKKRTKTKISKRRGNTTTQASTNAKVQNLTLPEITLSSTAPSTELITSIKDTIGTISPLGHQLQTKEKPIQYPEIKLTSTAPSNGLITSLKDTLNSFAPLRQQQLDVAKKTTITGSKEHDVIPDIVLSSTAPSTSLISSIKDSSVQKSSSVLPLGGNENNNVHNHHHHSITATRDLSSSEASAPQDKSLMTDLINLCKSKNPSKNMRDIASDEAAIAYEEYCQSQLEKAQFVGCPGYSNASKFPQHKSPPEKTTTSTNNIPTSTSTPNPDPMREDEQLQHEKASSKKNGNSSDKKSSGFALRRGKWEIEEENFAYSVINSFLDGILPIKQGTTLRSFLAKQLHCDPMRITKKLSSSMLAGVRVSHRVGKRTYRPQPVPLSILTARLSVIQGMYTAFWKAVNKSPPPEVLRFDMLSASSKEDMDLAGTLLGLTANTTGTFS